MKKQAYAKQRQVDQVKNFSFLTSRNQ